MFLSSNAFTTHQGHPWNRKLTIFVTYTVWISLGKAFHLVTINKNIRIRITEDKSKKVSAHRKNIYGLEIFRETISLNGVLQALIIQ